MKELGTAFGRNMIMALVLAVMIALALAATAQAQTPSDDQYGSPTGSENSSGSGMEDPGDEGSGTVASAVTGGVLPSTGGPLPVLAGLGVMLVISGAFVVRRSAGR